MTRAQVVPAVLSFLLLLGCECSDTGRVLTCESTSDCRAGESCIDGRCTRPTDGSTPGFDAGPPRRIASVRIEPASAMLDAVDGARPTVDFMAVAVYEDGSEGPAVGPTFAISTVSLGDLDPAGGEFVANGVIGGDATVSLSVPGPSGEDLTATASLTVRIRRNVRGEGVTDDDVARFDPLAPIDDPARNAAVVYPLDGVVMPQNVYPADVQWTRSAPGDLFRVTITKPSATVVAHLAYDPAMHWLVDEPAWRSLAQSDPDAPAELVVDRLEAATGEMVRSAPIRMTFARAALTGSVYYWDIVRGLIIRIDDGTATRNEFMPTPPIAMRGEGPCVGCHAVSPSGRYMAGRLGGGENIGAVFDLTTDLTPNPPPTVFPISAAEPTSLRWWFASWSPDETRMVVSIADPAALRIYDPHAGTEVPVTGALPTNATHPAWSPDGTRIAYVTGVNAWGGAFTTGNIAILPVLGPDSFGAPTTIHLGSSLAASSPPGNADSYPTWSPDSARIAFAHGDSTRSEWGPSVPPGPAGGPLPPNYSALYIMSPDGSGVQRLDRATGVEDYQPRFAPFQEGGYYWLSFLSRRDYGNAAVGSVGAHRQQIWVTAVRVGAAPGEDPSSVPYWLPGQNPRSMNISAYWAPRPCREDGEGCSVGSECCGGDCRPPAGGGAPVCSPPPPENCRRSGQTCTTTADCCPEMGLTCINRVCVAGPG